ncbi:hypothetical protein M2324_003952 [Rhodovulum sulfidophilum]|uniref:hypothetical protein n=1 Tax=Rhodovulum sulfidophilum TaxID=35806 RepID=UPI000AE96F6D|nr:hypothetical protein [Rhodovulum sulfidophilum]MCW2305526.1 hypothetical protein [Rhodovulum sulfidophilum]
MNTLSFNLDGYQVASLLSAFRERANIVLFWMQAAKTILSFVEPDPGQVHGRMIVCTGKMHRIFLESDGKVFSTALPFHVKTSDGFYSCTLRSGIDLSSKLTSEIIATLSSTESFQNFEILGFADDIMGVSDDPDTLWVALSELVNSDDGYLRFDHDPVRENGKLHPLNHIDIFFSQSATFKIGLAEKLEIDAFSDLLDVQTDCHYLSKD